MNQTRDLPQGLELRLEAVPQSVREARIAMAKLAREVGANPDDVELAVAEATANSVLHAYPEGSSGTLEVRGELDGDSLVVTITDDGQGIRPNPRSEGLGIGLALIGQMASSFNVAHRVGGGTAIEMRFPVTRRSG